jgi:serine/threonine-protein kinase
MATVDSEAQAVRRQLERALGSANFTRNERLSRFLRFVVERHLDGRDSELKESVIALEVFGKRDYDPNQDSVVRTEAGRLRARLAEYYVGEGKGEPVIIELPKGGYVPVFRRLDEGRLERKTLPGRRWTIVALASLALALATFAWWRIRQQGEPVAIAVLPLNNLSRDPADDYFADGLTGEIIRNLSIIEGLAVRSQTSSFAFKGKPRNVREVGSQLAADYILEGSVLRAGQQLRINAQFIRIRDDLALWTGRYDRELTDVFAIQDEISRGIVNSLRLKLGRGRRRYETNAEAYDLYLRGRAFEMQPALTGMTKSIGPFEKAIAKDPAFAPAYAGLADAYVALSGFESDQADRADQDRSDQISKMRAAAEKALQLDPLLAEAHSALAMVYARDGQWEESGKRFRRAVDLEPNSSVPRTQFARNLLLPLGRIEEAIAQLLLAEKSDPLSPDVQRTLARALFAAGRFDEAVTRCPKPCVDALLLQGRATEAIPILEARFHGNLSAPGSGSLGRAYALAGRREDAERIATIQWRPTAQAGIFTALGDKDRAFEALERAIPLGPVRMGRTLAFAEFAPLRGDPRVKALRKKVGLPD